MNPIARNWFMYERSIAGASHQFRRNLETGIYSDTEWEELERLIRLSAIAAGCSILESHGLRNRDIHTQILCEIRNALIHNSGDLSKNRNKKSLKWVENYSDNQTWLSLSQNAFCYFRLSGSVVEIDGGITNFIRLILI
jgi:hypothetical protein